MSRTIRKMLRHHSAPSVKAYKPGFYLLDEAVLKAGKPKVTTFHRYLKEKYIGEDSECVTKRRHGVDEYGRTVAYDYEDYITVPVERTRKVPNLEYVPEEVEAFRCWHDVHKYVYRNKTCRRQRKNAVRHAKRAASRHRRIEDLILLRKELSSFYEGVSDVSC